MKGIKKLNQKEKKILVPYAQFYYKHFKECSRTELRKEINRLKTEQVRLELMLLVLNKIDIDRGGKGWLCPIPLRKSVEAIRLAFSDTIVQTMRFT